MELGIVNGSITKSIKKIKKLRVKDFENQSLKSR
jgi:hypothetical protein